MDTIVIGVHGLDNKPCARIYQKWWHDSLLHGLSLIGNPSERFSFSLAYWAHTLNTQALDPAVTDPGDTRYVHEPFLKVSYAPAAEQQENNSALKKQLEKIAFKASRFINAERLADSFTRHFFTDLDMYLNRTVRRRSAEIPAKDEIRREVSNVIASHKGKRIMLIGHSMGALICYDVLTAACRHVNIHTFVTTGSPLGIPAIRNKIALEFDFNDPDSLRTPHNITNRWYNLADQRDAIAAFSTLRNYFRPNQRGVSPVDMLVRNGYSHNGTRNPHKSFGYLQTHQLALILFNFLHGSTSS